MDFSETIDICDVKVGIRGVKIKFSCCKTQITRSKIKLWIHHQFLPSLFYHVWFVVPIVVIIGSIPFLKASVLNLFISSEIFTLLL